MYNQIFAALTVVTLLASPAIGEEGLRTGGRSGRLFP
jgi:hypothetical protein